MNVKQNSLCGLVPPFSWYVDYVGKPLYKIARKMGSPKIGALAVANIPGSLSHVSRSLMDGDLTKAVLIFGVSELICTGMLYGIHMQYKSRQKRKLIKMKNSHSVNTLDDLVG
jgi:hypothetical protein